MGTRIIIDGIPSFFTDQQLKELFLRYGTVLSAEVKRYPNGESLGFGYVGMATSDAANTAIRQLNRSWLDGQVLVVKMEKKDTSEPT